MPTLAPTVTDPPRALPTRRPTQAPRVLLAPTSTSTPISTAIIEADVTPTPADDGFIEIGTSVGGRPITAKRYGDGERVLMLVGGVHGGWESNTVELMERLDQEFTRNPREVLPGISVWIVPVLNPDGVARGDDIEGRFNDNGVDLNRNWGCGWQPSAVWRGGPVDPGPEAMSEPEIQALAAFIERVQPGAVLFYHSAADGVFSGNCPSNAEESRSDDLAAVYGVTANYAYGNAFTAYPVTGTAPNWVDGLGIPAVDVELSSATSPQFDRNLRAVVAVQCWLLGRSAPSQCL